MTDCQCSVPGITGDRNPQDDMSSLIALALSRSRWIMRTYSVRLFWKHYALPFLWFTFLSHFGLHLLGLIRGPLEWFWSFLVLLCNYSLKQFPSLYAVLRCTQLYYWGDFQAPFLIKFLSNALHKKKTSPRGTQWHLVNRVKIQALYQ